MRKFFRYLGAIGIAAITASIIATAFADHGHASLAVPECQAYINVLETLDQLYFCRATAVELNHPDPADEIGSASAVMVLRSADTILRTVALPNAGFGLTAIYFEASAADIPIYNSSTTIVHLSENPALFLSPATSTNVFPEFNANISLDSTATELTSDIPKIMLRLQTDANLPEETYVLGTHVTDVGKTVVTDAYAPLGILAAGAFGLQIDDSGGIFTNPSDPTLLVGLQQAGRASQWAQDLEATGDQLGFPYPATIMMLMLGILFFITFMVWKTSGQTDTIYIWVFPILWIGGTLGGWPLAVPVAVAALTAAVGMSLYVRDWISS